MNKKCLNCNNFFYTTIARIESGRGKYCSRKCKTEYSLHERICPTCGKKFVVHGYILRYKIKTSKRKTIFCSMSCSSKGKNSNKSHSCWNKGTRGIIKANSGSFKKGITPWNKGKKIFNIRDENHPNWKGEEASYTAIHDWVKLRLGRPQKCDNCGDVNSRYFDWASISHKCKRDLKDWIRLCRVCHRNYDLGKINLKGV